MRILLLILFCGTALSAQNICFEPWFVGQRLQFDEANEGGGAGAEVRIETMRIYLSGFTLTQASTVVYREAESYHLLDAADSTSLAIALAAPAGLNYDSIRFLIGVDSTRAAGGVFGGDLDPTNGMYWTWRSGYINFKLEGTAPNCPARKNRFQFHVGGYASPFNTVREVKLPLEPMDKATIRIDLDALLAQVDLRRDYQIMSPNAAAIKLSNRLPALFTVINNQ